MSNRYLRGPDVCLSRLRGGPASSLTRLHVECRGLEVVEVVGDRSTQDVPSPVNRGGGDPEGGHQQRVGVIGNVVDRQVLEDLPSPSNPRPAATCKAKGDVRADLGCHFQPGRAGCARPSQDRGCVGRAATEARTRRGSS